MIKTKAVKFLFFACLVGIIAGCKIAVIVVEGGEVQSTGSGTCVASTICIVDVTDTNFSESFTAVPDEGWYFEKWNSGDRFLCGDSTDRICRLSFQGHEDSKAVEDMVASTEVFYIMPVFKPYQDTIAVIGKEWLQPALFTNLSWNDINAVCSEGVCAGMLNGYDMTGWTWASVDDVNALFNQYIGFEALGPGRDRYLEVDSQWSPAFFNDGWRPFQTNEIPAIEPIAVGVGVGGWLREKNPGDSDAGLSAGITDFSMGTEAFNDSAETASQGNVGQRSSDNGAWFYRAP